MKGIISPPYIIVSAQCLLIWFLLPAFGQSGALNVTSQPSGASVYLDEQEIGSTPIINFMVRAGSHKLQLTDQNSNKSAVKIIQILPDSSLTLEVPLDVSYGNLDVDCSPRGATVSLSTNLGAAPLKNARLIAGDYTIKIESSSPFYKPVTKAVTVPINGTEPVTVKLPRNGSHLFKVGTQVLLALAAIGSSAIGYVQEDKGARGVCFTASTLCVCGVGLLLFF
jgi:hypothetical protein